MFRGFDFKMRIEYKLGKTPSGRYPQLKCDDEEAIVKSLGIFDSEDAINFNKKDITVKGFPFTYGSYWGLSDIGCFRELQRYNRLIDMPEEDIARLGKRMYELLFMEPKKEERYSIAPEVDVGIKEYQQIIYELSILKETEKRLIDSGEIVFPGS
jgi:hypothetical protein